MKKCSARPHRIGRNDFIGGVNIATTHIDGGRPPMEIDGRTVIDNGEHVQ
jgi:leucyl aminopeptidase (aminopeptidase T)